MGSLKIMQILIFIIIVLIFILLFSGCSHPNLITHGQGQEKIIIQFLNKDNAYQYLEDCDFVNRMNNLNSSIRLNENFQNDDNTSLIHYKSFLKNNLKDWNEYEKKKIWNAFTKSFKRMNNLSPELIPDTLFFIKTSLVLEFNSFFTAKKAICVPTSVIWPFLFDDLLEKKICHELFHIYSRYHKNKRDQLYKLFNFYNCRNLDIGNYLKDKMINNPDVHSNNYILNLKDSLGNNKNLLLTAQLDEKRYNSNKKVISFLGNTNIFGYFTHNLYEVEEKDKNSYLVKNKDNPTPLDWNLYIKDFNLACGCLTNNRLFPEEIITKSFVNILFSYEKDDFMEKYTEIDRKKITNFIKIIIN